MVVPFHYPFVASGLLSLKYTNDLEKQLRNVDIPESYDLWFL